MVLLRILRADWLLTKRTGYRWLVFAAPRWPREFYYGIIRAGR
ncbi:hypothetical protein HMSSN036_79090 [Paenibacillus macerans]|nr:hypothetical protein HMSSN036_79090 [Paenibacillus macerans]